jgi:hypothetical protein
MKPYEDPKWAQSMKLSLDHNYAMAEFLGESGLTESDLQGLAPRLRAFHQSLAGQREGGQLGFMELPYQTQVVKEVRKVAKPLLEWCWESGAPPWEPGPCIRPCATPNTTSFPWPAAS